MIEEGQTGFTVPVGDYKGFVDVLERLQRHPELQNEVAFKAHETIVARYTAKRMAEQYAELVRKTYADLVEGTYKREPSIHYLPYIGHVAPPPDMQLHKHHIRSGRQYWDQGELKRS